MRKIFFLFVSLFLLTSCAFGGGSEKTLGTSGKQSPFFNGDLADLPLNEEIRLQGYLEPQQPFGFYRLNFGDKTYDVREPIDCKCEPMDKQFVEIRGIVRQDEWTRYVEIVNVREEGEGKF